MESLKIVLDGLTYNNRNQQITATEWPTICNKDSPPIVHLPNSTTVLLIHIRKQLSHDGD